MRQAFNDYLYNLRIKKGFTSVKKFAKEIGVSAFRYGSYERGYLQPNAKDKAKIEAYSGESLDPYLVGKSSYPAPMKPKKTQVFHGLAKLFTNKIARIVTYVLMGIGLLCIPASIIINSYNDTKHHAYYDQNYVEIYNKVKEEGTFTIDILGFFDKREISYVEEGFCYVTVKAPVSEYGMKEIYYEATIRNLYERYDIKYKNANNVTFIMSDNQTGEYWSYRTTRIDANTLRSGTFSNAYHKDKWTPQICKNFVNNELPTLITKTDGLFARLFSTKFGKENVDFYNDILLVKKKGDTIQNNLSTAFNITAFIGIPIGIISLALILLWWLYMYPEKMMTLEVNENSVEQETEHKYHPLPTNKTHLHFFMGEEAIRIIGVVLLIFGSVRSILALVTQAGFLSLIDRSFNATELLNISVNIFFLGIFLNYITEMDSLNDEKRLFRNIVIYGLLFLTIGGIQTAAVSQLDYLGNGIIYTLEAQLPNNIFGMIFLYFLTAVFLYYLPKKFEGKKGLTLMWRWFSLIPVLMVFSLYLFIQYFPTLFGYDTPKYLAYFFGAERLPFAVLTFIYLFGTYFLRRYYYRKYGEKNAKTFFYGNRYLNIKNFIIVAGAIGLFITELTFLLMIPDNKFGFGQSLYIGLIAPLFIFFRPRNGNRNTGTSIVSSALYVMAIVIYYSLTIGLLIINGIS